MVEYQPEDVSAQMARGGLSTSVASRRSSLYIASFWRRRSSPHKTLKNGSTAAGELNAAVSEEGVRAVHCDDVSDRRPCSRVRAPCVSCGRSSPSSSRFATRCAAKYLECPHRAMLPRDEYFVFDRAEENRRTLYREANIPRETELAELEQSYQKTIGAMTVRFRGEERTPAGMAPFLEETDRARGKRPGVSPPSAGSKIARRSTSSSIRMLEVRGEVAREAGFEGFVPYAYRLRERFDYGPEDVERFHEAIEAAFVPLAKKLREERSIALGLDSLRPWDLAVDPLGRAPLKPFSNVAELVQKTQSVFDAVDPELGGQFDFLNKQGLLDLANRKGKAPGGYQTTLEDARLPFIFMNAVGVDNDMRTLLHEGGHAFHALASRGLRLAAYRECPIEFCEVASMTMELLGARDLEAFYAPADADRSYRQLLEGIVLIMPWIAQVDAFQHWIYSNPGHSRRDRGKAWVDLDLRFGSGVDWSGLEEPARARGIDNCTSFYTHFIILSTASRSSAPCGFGVDRLRTAAAPLRLIAARLRLEEVGGCPNFSRLRGLRLILAWG